jgi:multidrug efflux system membrane fusion protein
VRLPGSAEFKATLIDDKAVLTDQDRKYVYIVDKDGKAQRRDITPGVWQTVYASCSRG